MIDEKLKMRNLKCKIQDSRLILRSALYIFHFAICIVLLSCATTGPAKKGSELGVQSSEKQQMYKPQQPELRTQNSKPVLPEFVPVSEELSPLKTRIVSVSARATPLRDVLLLIAESTGLNLVMEKGVDPEIPITLTLNNVSAEDALNTIFSSVDYFYSIRENMLIVKAMETRIFEFGQPSVIQDYAVDVGGDILGGATTGATTTGAVTTGTTSIKGNVAQKIQADKDSFKLWDSIEKTIGGLLGITAGTTKAAGTEGKSAAVTLQPSFSVNRMAGTIVVTATKKDLERVENYLKELKKILGRQVIIEARIVEVQLSEGLKYGIDWSALDINNLGQVTFGTTKFSDVVGDLPSFQIGISRWDFTGLLKALQTQGDVRVLSNPRVNIMNGQTALLSVGRNVNFISRVETTTTAVTTGIVPTTTFTVQTSSVLSGVIIGLIPHIDEKGDVSMTVTPIVSDLVRLDDRTIGKIGENTIQISLPTVDLRELSTTVKVRDGQMVIIGGLIHNRDKLQDSQVPFLGQIPLIGYLFKSREMLNERTELIIMLKPMIVTP
ncbi:MAG: pilus (MSHA type) biogenesis protein MshL [Thermodesulfovibrionales bacterium]